MARCTYCDCTRGRNADTCWGCYIASPAGLARLAQAKETGVGLCTVCENALSTCSHPASGESCCDREECYVEHRRRFDAWMEWFRAEREVERVAVAS